MNRFSVFFCVALLMIGACTISVEAGKDSAGNEGQYKADWQSLSKHQVPEWFRDAKFGIYTHWGPITYATEDAPSEMEWYARQLYEKEHPAFKYHREKFGDQKKVGYKDVIPYFKAEKFNADEWAELFAKSGAKFAGPVVIHHDNFAMWDSKITRWNSMNMGPKHDITGELEKAIKKRGMKFITTFHHGFTWRYYEPAYNYDASDANYSDLYVLHSPGAEPTKEFQDLWLAKINEVVTKYEPDLIWFDFGLAGSNCIKEEYRKRMFANYYNWAADKGIEVAVAHKHPEIHKWTGILDFERGREDKLTDYPWLTDTSVGPWFHHNCLSFKTVNELVDILVDIVSKNGCMLLNVGPKADGTIPDKGRELLLGIGDWLKINGEAIYGTRPWRIYGQGPTKMDGGAFSERPEDSYTKDDIRFTQSKDGKTIYVIVLDWPQKSFTIESMKINNVNENASVELLGYEGRINHKVSKYGQLFIEVPSLSTKELPCEHAFSFKLSGFKVSPVKMIKVEIEKATFEGSKVRLQTLGGRPNIGYWDDAWEKVHFLVYIPKSGKYSIIGEFSAGYASSRLTVKVSGQEKTIDIPRTDGWFNTEIVDAGEFDFNSPGVHHLVLQPAEASKWKAVNVWELHLSAVE